MTVAEIINAILTTALTSTDRVALVRAIRDTVPDLVARNDSLTGRIRAASKVPAEFVDNTLSALALSAVWKLSAAADVEGTQRHRDFAENAILADEVRAFSDIFDYNMRYHHFAATDKARAIYRAGKTLGGVEGAEIKPHVVSIGALLPSPRRKKKAAAPPDVATTPAPPKP